ncbi:hypothetical protein [Halobacterium noricense]|uniref:hypothetical protein n=1 Tax=Halobacterium noricense TaxID=223182 RepID=UPI001E4AC0AE|nr:hypothetical protein [Halobacterium noricense]UHH24384.1 hypothetical protein LT974_10330 [Halobacterium noricense]
MTDYRPGQCNIGSEQRQRRARIAALAFLTAAAVVAAYLAGALPEPLLLVVFVPLAVGFEWAFQADESFCVRLALAGQYAFGDDREDVPDAADRRTDQLYAAKITATSVLLAAVVTAALVFAL